MTDETRGGALGAETAHYWGAGPGAAHDGAAQAGGRPANAAGRAARDGGAGVPGNGADLNGWRDAFLEAGAASLKSRPRDDRDARIAHLRAKLGEVTMDNELLQEKIARMEAGRPLRNGG